MNFRATHYNYSYTFYLYINKVFLMKIKVLKNIVALVISRPDIRGFNYPRTIKWAKPWNSQENSLHVILEFEYSRIPCKL